MHASFVPARLLAGLVFSLALAASAQVPDLSHALLSRQAVTDGHGTSLHATGVTGNIQWQFRYAHTADWLSIIDDPPILGVTTPTLEISSVHQPLDGADFRISVVVAGVAYASNTLTLSVTPQLFPQPTGLALDAATGDLIVSDAANHAVWRVKGAEDFAWLNDVRPLVSVVAGSSGQAGFADGPASGSLFNQPAGVVALPNGRILVADTANASLRQIAGSAVTSLAGSPQARDNADGTGALGHFMEPNSVAAYVKAGAEDVYYVTDSASHVVRKVTSNGMVSTLAGSAGSAGFADGAGAEARFNHPTGIGVDLDGVIYVADTNNNVIRRITPDGVVTTVAGLPGVAGAQDGTGADARFNGPTGLVVAAHLVASSMASLYVSDTGNSTIRRVTGNGIVTTYAGTPTVAGMRDGTGYLSFDGLLNHPGALAWDPSDLLYIADTGNAAIRVISQYDGVMMTLPVASASPASAPAAQPPPAAPAPVSTTTGASPPRESGGGSCEGWFAGALALLGLARFFAANSSRSPWRLGGLAAVVVALGLAEVFSSEARASYLDLQPDFQNVTAGRNVSFVAEGAPTPIRWQVSKNNGSSFADLAEDATFVGTTSRNLEIVGVTTAMSFWQFRFTCTANGVDVVSTPAVLTVSPAYLPMPSGIAVDGGQTIYVSDESSHQIFKGLLVPADIGYPSFPTHIALTAMAGKKDEAGTANGPGVDARFSHPAGIALGRDGSVTVADTANGMIRRVTSVGVVSTLAGDSATRGNVDGAGVAARFGEPRAIARTLDGTFFVADAMNHVIRKVTADGVVTTFAGSPGNAGWLDGAGDIARFNRPSGIAVDDSGTVYVADTANNLIRRITPAGVVSTLAGVPSVAGDYDGLATQATFNAPAGVAVTHNGGLIFVADTGNSTIRMVLPGAPVSVRTYAGTSTVSGLRDGYPGLLHHPTAIAVDDSTDYYSVNVFFADTGNAAIRVASWDSGLRTILLTDGSPLSTTPASPPPSTTRGGTTGTPVTSIPTSSGNKTGGGALGGDFAALLALLLLIRRCQRPRSGG